MKRNLYKKGEKKCISNYRQVSLPTSFSKVLGSDMYNRLFGHLNDNNILVEEGIRFRKILTTEKAIYELMNELIN